jgi:3-keto steroid reductase
VCQRLLAQLSLENPPDAAPQFDFSSDAKEAQEPFLAGQALTLVMACRNVKKAEAARQQLYRFLDSQLASRKKNGKDEYGELFKKNLRVDIESLDLALVSSVVKFSQVLHVKYIDPLLPRRFD